MHSIVLPKVAIVGDPETGSSLAHALLLSGCNPEIIFVDHDQVKAEERVVDLQQSVLFSYPREIRAGTIGEVSRADMTVICGQATDENPESRLAHNLALIQEVASEIDGANPDAILLIGGSPIDLLTFIACRISGLPRRQVIGTGTIVKTATLRYLLGRHFQIDPRSVHAYVFGGDGGEFPIWSSASIAGMPLLELCHAHGCSPAVLDGIFDQVRNRIRAATVSRSNHYSAGAGLARIAAAILRNENHVCPVSAVLRSEYGLSDVALSVPVVLNEKGIDRILRVELSDQEVGDLLASGRKNREAIARVKLSQPHRHATAAEVC